jgi:predicted ATPase
VDRKAGKLLRVTLLAREDRIQEVGISGDFFTQPFSGHLGELEQALAGARLDPLELRSILSDWERRFQVKLIGIGLDDLVSAIMEAGSDPGPRTA